MTTGLSQINPTTLSVKECFCGKEIEIENNLSDINIYQSYKADLEIVRRSAHLIAGALRSAGI